MREPDAVLLAQHAGIVEPDHQRGGGRKDHERVDAAAATLGLIRVARGQGAGGLHEVGGLRDGAQQEGGDRPAAEQQQRPE